MASNRVYRNYTDKDSPYDTQQQRASAPKRTQTTGSSRNFESGPPRSTKSPSDNEKNSTDSSSNESRLVFRPSDSGTALPTTSEDVKQDRRTPPSRGSKPSERSTTTESKSSPTKATQRPSERSNQESQVVSQRDAPPPSRHGASGDATSGEKMPDFFGLAIFQTVLRNPAIAHQLLKFGQSRLCGEHMEFLIRVNNYHLLLREVSQSISGIFEDFFADEAPKYLNVPQSVNGKVNKEIKSAISTTLPNLEDIFVSAQTDVQRLIYGDIYPSFVRHQMSISAAKALGGAREQYAGLGDCFVLTDPSKADNPIVFASDGFVKVTGHPRREIIPRNCRFLQSQQTERAAIKRIKDAVDKREESVELLLNKKKNGEPFWNLLYVTPLFGHDGELVFFLGGQINCSTSIHSTNDVLRVLSQSSNAEQDSRTNSLAPKLSSGPSRTFRHPFTSTGRSSTQERAPGMESSLLDRLENMPLTSQFREFYTAYSNFIVINYSTWLIAFVSGGVLDLLFPIKAKAGQNILAVGTDIFKFLGNHGSGSTSWEFKSSVKNSIKLGQAVSLDLKLCAKPTMGFENFVLHWTPLKDEIGSVKWIVLTLGNEQRA